jgi:hypothetical protein
MTSVLATDVRDRFRMAAAEVVGAQRAREIERFVDGLEHSDDVGLLGMLLRAEAS